MINVPGELNATNTTFIGGMQSVIVRGGDITATFDSCHFENNVTGNSVWGWQAGLSGSGNKTWPNGNPIDKWGTGNCIPMACLTIGNDATAPGDYNTTAPSTVTLTNCTFESIGTDDSGHEYMTVYIEGANSTANVTLNYDSATAASIDGTGYGLVYGANVVINGAAMHGEGDCNRIYAATPRLTHFRCS